MDKKNTKITKVISLSYEAWKILKELKRPGQSYSGVIIELLGPILQKRKAKEARTYGRGA